MGEHDNDQAQLSPKTSRVGTPGAQAQLSSKTTGVEDIIRNYAKTLGQELDQKIVEINKECNDDKNKKRRNNYYQGGTDTIGQTTRLCVSKSNVQLTTKTRQYQKEA